MASRALPDLIARIRLDSSGFDEALGGLTKSFNRTNLEMAGTAAGLALIIAGGKSMIDIAAKHETAQSDLAQAFRGSVRDLQTYRDRINDFIATNQPFIQNQADVIEGFATLTRGGADMTKAMADMNISLDLSTLKHIPLADAVKLVNLAEQGRFKGLLDLGINIKGVTAANADAVATDKEVVRTADLVTAAQKNVTDAQRRLTELEESQREKKKLTVLDQMHLADAHKAVTDATDKLTAATDKHTTALTSVKGQTDVVAKAMQDLAGKTKDGRNTLSDLDQQTDKLRGHWETLATEAGPILLKKLDELARGANAVYDQFDRWGKDQKMWDSINNHLISLLGWMKAVQLQGINMDREDHGLKPLLANWSPTWATDNNLGGAVSGVDPNPYGSGRGRASGGPVLPNSVYTVGERGPETLTMGAAGGYVTPNGGLSKVYLANDRQGDVVALLGRVVQLLEASPGFTTKAYGRS